jgi:hypothetical protein
VPALTYSYTGLVNGDASASFSGALATVATSSSNVGSYAITQGTLAATGNYTISVCNNGTLAVNPATLTITPTAGQSKVYGGAVQTLTYTAGGLVNGDPATTLTGSLGTTATAASPVGSYAFTASGFSAGANYTVALAANAPTFTVTPAALTVTAEPGQSMIYGATVPSLAYSYTGLVNGDASASFSGALATAATSPSNVGSYAITQGTLAATGNYSIRSFSGGTLIVTPAPLTVTVQAGQSMTYGGAVPALTYNYVGLVNHDSSAAFSGALATTATSSSNVGSYAITQGTLAANGNYTIGAFSGGSLTVNPATLTVTASSASRVYGTTNPTFTASYSGFKNGQTLTTSGVTGSPSLTTVAAPSSQVGTYPIVAARGNLAATNYTFAFVNGTLSITPATLTATGTSFKATAGAPTTIAVATFVNADPFGGPGSYAASIAWGDGTSSSGTLTAGSAGVINVTGTHTYASAATCTVTVSITHLLGSTTPATARTTATVSSLGTRVQSGQGATIGFWQGKNGQALIGSFNGGPTAMALGNWLAASFSNLFGAGAGSNNLAGMTNAQVAAFYLNSFNQSGLKLTTQILATALNVYATTLSLGGTAAQAYGFTVNAYGLGASSYSVGTNGAAFGVSNNTVLDIYQMLLAANANAAGGVLYGGNATLQLDAANVFSAVNVAGGV